MDELTDAERVQQVAASAGGLSELAFNLQAKFDWSNLFDLIRLGHVITTGLTDIQPKELTELPSAAGTDLELQAYMCSVDKDYQEMLTKLVQSGYDGLEVPVLSCDGLKCSLNDNVFKTFIMPVFAELVSLHRMTTLRDQLKAKLDAGVDDMAFAAEEEAEEPESNSLVGTVTSLFQAKKDQPPQRRFQAILQPPKTSEYAVKLVDHFISFIQHLDNFLEDK